MNMALVVGQGMDLGTGDMGAGMGMGMGMCMGRAGHWHRGTDCVPQAFISNNLLTRGTACIHSRALGTIFQS